MENTKPLTHGEIQKMALSTFKTLHQDETIPDTSYIRLNGCEDYTDLMGKLESLLNVVMSAIEAKEAFAPVHHKNDDIVQVLSIAKEFIPYPEIEFLDNIHKRVKRG